jgi:hypothetical protein
MSDLVSSLLIFTIIKTILRMLCSIATLDREWRTPWTQNESNRATYKKTEVRNSLGFSFEIRKIPLRFKQH